MSAALPAHPKVIQLGKVRDLFNGTIIVEEKIDGSQFGFGRAADDGRLVFRSKGRELFPESVDKLFGNTVAAVQAREDRIMGCLQPGEFLYGEALHAPKHNTLAYERAPQGHLVLFGGLSSGGAWIPRSLLEMRAAALDFDVTPVLYRFEDANDSDITALVAHLRTLVDGPSFLGGRREGIVVKNYSQQIHYNGVLSPIFCKMVSEGFKEAHNENWKPGRDLLAELLDGYRSTARWDKAVQYLREQGELTDTPKDIGPLVRRVQEDLWAEEAEEFGRKLAMHYKDEVRRIATRGLPEWYKNNIVDRMVTA